MSLNNNLFMAFNCFSVALFSAGIGIGGGTLLVSSFVSLLKFDFKNAAGASQAAIIPIALVGSIFHFLLSHNISALRYHVLFIPMCILGTIMWCNFMEKWNGTGLKFMFSCFLLIASFRMLNILDIPFFMFEGLHETPDAIKFLFIALFGIFVGVSATLLGIGCGLMIVPFFVIVVDLNIHEAIQLSLTAMFFLTVTATFIRSKFKTLKFLSLKGLIFSSLGGAMIGTFISSSLPAPYLKRIFAVFLFLIASSYLINILFCFFSHCYNKKLIPCRFKGETNEFR